MPNIAVVLKDEIRRLAKKEVRAVAGPLRKRVADLEKSNAAYKRQVPSLLRTVARLESEAKARQLQAVQAGAKAEGRNDFRVGPRSIRAQRKRLKLTRDEFGRLAGVSANTVYLWETGEVSPKDANRKAIVGLRKLGVREARGLLDAAAPENRKKTPKTPRKKAPKRASKARGKKK